MKKIVILLGVLVSVSCAHAQPPDGPGMGKIIPVQPEPIPAKPEPIAELGPVRYAINCLNNPLGKVDLSTPEKTVRSFVWALNNADVNAARQCVFNAKVPEELRPLEDQWKKGYKSYIFLISESHAYLDEECATVVLRLDFLSSSPQPKNYGSCERLHLVKTGESWQILSEPKTDVPPPLGRRAFVEDLMTRMLVELVEPPNLTTEESNNQCQSNLKEIGKAFVFYVQDYDEKWPPVEDWQNQILAYAPDEKLFVCPNAKEGEISFSYNPAFRGATLAAVAASAQTILLYEGKDKKFDFRHELNGIKLTNILFADGHVKAFSQETLDAAMKNQMLQWKLEQ